MLDLFWYANYGFLGVVLFFAIYLSVSGLAYLAARAYSRTHPTQASFVWWREVLLLIASLAVAEGLLLLLSGGYLP